MFSDLFETLGSLSGSSGGGGSIGGTETSGIFTAPETIKQTSVYSTISTIYGTPDVGTGRFNGGYGDVDPGLNKFNDYDHILHITPGDMMYNESSSILNAWNFVPKIGEFQSYLASVLGGAGISSAGIPGTLKFYLADITCTDTVSSHYGDNILSNVNNMINQVVSDYSYMSNGDFETFKRMMSNNLKSMLGDDLANKILSGLHDITQTAQNALKSVTGKDHLIDNDSIMHDLLSGYKIDLPKTWKNSSNTKQISGRIRLMTAVDNPQAIIDKIIIPYAALLVLASPRSTNKYLYKWPFVLHTQLPGYADIRLSVITDLQIQKGVDEVLSYDNKYLAMDLVVTILPLYNTQFMVRGSQPGDMLTVNHEIKHIAEYFNKKRV